jgi:5'-3' exonuclease
MGIEKFFSSWSKSKIIPNVIFPLLPSNPLVCKYLCIDFNSIVHVKNRQVTSDLNKMLYVVTSGKGSIQTELDTFNKKYNGNVKDVLNVTSEQLDALVTTCVLNYVKTICSKYIDSKHVEHIMIAIDGVPPKAKMIQQRKRRYSKYILHYLQRDLLAKHKNKMTPERRVFEEKKYSWNTGNITPATPYISQLENIMMSNEFKNEMQQLCPNLKNFIVSGTNVPSEGEKKIVNYLRTIPQADKNNLKNNIVFYSPDSDVIILSMLLETDIMSYKAVNGITMLRHNQQTNGYEHINIGLAAKHLHEYIQQKAKMALNKDNVIHDLCFIFTLFGNDFVPKIVSYDVGYFFEFIVDNYVVVLQNATDNAIDNTMQHLIVECFRDKTITNCKCNKMHVNQQKLTTLFDLLASHEKQNLQVTYLLNNFFNANKYINIFKSSKSSFIDDLKSFLANMHDLIDAIKNGNNSQINKLRDNDNFVNIMRRCVIDKNDPINEFVDEYNKTNKFMPLDITFYPFNQTINDDRHKQKLDVTREGVYKTMSIIDYDKQKYKMENMLDEYQKLFHAYKSKMGKISLDLKNYELTETNLDDDIDTFYKKLGIDYQNDISKLDTLILSYIEGLIWTFNNYFNSYDDNEDVFGDVWYYKYDESPLMSHIAQFMKKQNDMFLQTVNKNMKQYKIAVNNYFSTISQLLYVTPPYDNDNGDLDFIDSKYRSFFKKSFYPNIRQQIDELAKGNNTLLDCENSLYFEKCHINNIELKISDNDFMFEVSKFL